jgi:hypothetical protein
MNTNPSINYTPLHEAVEVEAPKSTPTPSTEEMLLIRRSSRGVVLLCFTQMMLAVLLLLQVGALLVTIVTSIFAFIGIAGAARKNFRLLIAHFVYSLLLYILTLVGLIAVVIYCDNCGWFTYATGFIFILCQAVGMRHSRILIGLLRKYSNCPALITRRCQRSCRSRRSCSTSQTQTPVSTESSTQTAPAIQVPPQIPVPPTPTVIPTQMVYPQPDVNQAAIYPPMYMPQGYYVQYPNGQMAILPQMPMYATAPQDPQAMYTPVMRQQKN